MRKTSIWIIQILICFGCAKESSKPASNQEDQLLPMIGLEKAIEISQMDAVQANYVLGDYNIKAEIDSIKSPVSYRIDYELLDSNLNGGGPHYRIDAQSGFILEKCYTQ